MSLYHCRNLAIERASIDPRSSAVCDCSRKEETGMEGEVHGREAAYATLGKQLWRSYQSSKQMNFPSDAIDKSEN